MKDTKGKKPFITVYVPMKDRERFNEAVEIAQKFGMSRSSMVRAAVEMWRKRNSKPRRGRGAKMRAGRNRRRVGSVRRA